MNQDLDPITLLVDMPCARKSVSIIWKFEKMLSKGIWCMGVMHTKNVETNN
jgi:predicted ATP-dependent Lon-type protease